MTKLSYKQRARQQREQEILLYARRMIQADGAARLNMDCLADAVGISKPTLYQHFKSKEDLLAHVFVESILELEQFLQSTTEPSPLARLKSALRLALVNRYSHDGLLTGFEGDAATPAIHAHETVIAAKQRVLSMINQIVEDGKTQGEITHSVSTLMIGCMVVKMIALPGVAMSIATQLDAPIDDLDQLIDNTLTLFERAVVPHTSTE